MERIYLWRLLKMFKYTKMIITAASLLAFCSGQLYAGLTAGTDVEDDKPKRTGVVATTGTPDPRFQEDMPKEIMRLIFVEASKDTKPGCLASVCGHWHNVMREDNPIEPLLNYSTLNRFMKDCMKIWWTEIFYKGVLLYKDPNDGKEITLRVSELKEPFKGTFDLSACGNTANKLVITTSVDRFFKVKAENEERVVILITPRHVVEEEINSSAQPFSPFWPNGMQAGLLSPFSTNGGIT